jgi:hypothetical protein
MTGTALPITQQKLRIRWSCGLPGCHHETRKGAIFHGLLMEQGLPQIILDQSRSRKDPERLLKG